MKIDIQMCIPPLFTKYILVYPLFYTIFLHCALLCQLHPELKKSLAGVMCFKKELPLNCLVNIASFLQFVIDLSASLEGTKKVRQMQFADKESIVFNSKVLSKDYPPVLL